MAPYKKTLTVSAPPHIYGNDTITRRMRDVLIALAPAAFAGIFYFGRRAFLIIAVSIISAVLAEYLFQKVTGKAVTIHDCSAAITGLLIALTLPPAVPLWVPVIGGFFAVVAVKQLFGGLGSNFMNPALAARAFLVAAFPVYMTNWVFPRMSEGADAVAGATYLTIIKQNTAFVPESADYAAVFFGNIGGCIGETSALALIAGGIFLIFRRVINWRVPVFYVGSFGLFAFIFGRNGYFAGENIFFEMMAGGLLLGAIFMATDYATTPISPRGKIIMGIGCGFLTVMIRFYSGYPEGVCFAIIIMNVFVPIIDKYIRPRVYGRRNRES
ncbi:MAG: RnfABCDGE type electron transport complex subunit D [Oscillospiraceae bacterium]|nr:RnfABCDGE type electron transport complex subunit D [Oscillospiraceae bacterium]